MYLLTDIVNVWENKQEVYDPYDYLQLFTAQTK